MESFQTKTDLVFSVMQLPITKNLFQCAVTYKNDERDQTVVSVPANAGDIFWSMDTDIKDRQKMINDGIDRLISPDGKSGRIHDLINSGSSGCYCLHTGNLFITQGT